MPSNQNASELVRTINSVGQSNYAIIVNKIIYKIMFKKKQILDEAYYRSRKTSPNVVCCKVVTEWSRMLRLTLGIPSVPQKET